MTEQIEELLEGHVQVRCVGKQSDQFPRPYLWKGHSRAKAADAAQYGWWCCLYMLVSFVPADCKGDTLAKPEGCTTNGGAPSHERDSPRGLVVSPREGTL